MFVPAFHEQKIGFVQLSAGIPSGLVIGDQINAISYLFHIRQYQIR
jgi:hypothetical protein